MEHIKRLSLVFFIFMLSLQLTGCNLRQKFRQKICESEVERLSEGDIYGIIVKKYEDLQSHGIETIQIRQEGRLYEVNFASLYHIHQLWDHLEVGDSLAQEDGSATYKVYRDGYKSFEVTLECPKMPDGE